MTTEAGFEVIMNYLSVKDGSPAPGWYDIHGKPGADQNLRAVAIEVPSPLGVRNVGAFVGLLNRLAALQDAARTRLLNDANGQPEPTDHEVARLEVEHDLPNTTVLLIDPAVPRPNQ